MKRRMLMLRVAWLAAFASFASAAAAQAPPAQSAAAPLSDGEVRKVDAENRKLTLRHGPLVHLDMPAMTMVFQVNDEVLLQGLSVGDKVRFAAEKIDGKFTVIRIEPAP